MARRVAAGPRRGQTGFRNISLKTTFMLDAQPEQRMFSDGLQVSSKGLPASTKCLTSLPMCKGTQCFFFTPEFSSYMLAKLQRGEQGSFS